MTFKTDDLSATTIAQDGKNTPIKSGAKKGGGRKK